MKTFDDYGLKMCRFQAELFAKSENRTSCSSPVFLRRFMYSEVARRMDGKGFLYEATGIDDVFDEIELQFGNTDYGQKKYDPEILYWIGYIYRYWSYTHEISSKKLYKRIKPEELKALYYPYHSLDPGMAIDRIIEAKQLTEEDYIEKGVSILRKLREEDNRYSTKEK